MKKWILKAIVQKTISYLPQKEKINYLFQKYVTKGVLLNDEYFELKLIAVKDHIDYFNKFKEEGSSQAEILELGTGWYPIVPLSLYLIGENRISSIDTQNWLTKDRFVITIEKFVEWKENGKVAKFLQIKPEKWEKLMNIYENRDQLSLNEIIDSLEFNFVIGDARKMDCRDGTYDFICSNNTFEHIPEEILVGILREFKRVLKNNGVMSHFIDMSDHFAHFDKSINIYNFLQFSESQWGWIDNGIQPQNRLRFKDYIAMYNQLGITIVHEEIRDGDIDLLNRINLDSKFKSYSSKELAISHGYLISKN